MYREMGSIFLGTYMRHDIRTTSLEAEYNPPFNHDQVIRRIRCFMEQREKSEENHVSFYDQGSTNDLRVMACKALTLKKTFAPPFGVLADAVARSIETEPVPMKAGLQFDETDKSYTLWMVKDSPQSVELCNEYVIFLCIHTC